ncbi:hypothetical protein L1987_09331 [Smallanthus sonchifolius]|uniref:Uncharacterized protein n=1 Tax=Smallanthus sonchifolius TaxID=185202 RepID=A0ACB9JN43_9ASTR|nr:hypothetical protein L1987_09331 [Smallanthus sonchifolius]
MMNWTHGPPGLINLVPLRCYLLARSFLFGQVELLIPKAMHQMILLGSFLLRTPMLVVNVDAIFVLVQILLTMLKVLNHDIIGNWLGSR